MVTRAITIMQHLLQNCYCVCGHFWTSGIIAGWPLLLKFLRKLFVLVNLLQMDLWIIHHQWINAFFPVNFLYFYLSLIVGRIFVYIICFEIASVFSLIVLNFLHIFTQSSQNLLKKWLLFSLILLNILTFVLYLMSGHPV